ncbi:abscission/NoCut checkpoint regulator isoform X2 [Cyanistes caeruleus]|uniref:abscission/NoCut checkpoint regulator isoform X2 n=1 Tax=Cyanistes caeruleus TaxID=156563 RepID=UPI000CD9FACC|nr:abscission/NoCut checkpoint regulator isoform X2 [Cyanistes caeruleus]
MDSRCYGCASKFSVFKKECGCKNCGRSFCSGCRSFSAVVPRCGNTQQKVCKECHDKLTGEGSQSSSAKWSPPENYKKRVAAFEAKQNQLKEQRKVTAKPRGQAGGRYQGLSKEDRAIAERLERLREERKPTVSSQSLNDLNQESEDCVCPANLDPKQIEEEKNKLLAEAAAELQEENTRQEKILQVAKRLAALKGEDPEKVTLETYKLPDSDEEVAEEEAIRRVLKQLTEEAALDEASGFNIPPDQTTQPGPSQQNLCKKAKQKSHTPATSALARADDSDEDELPWCCICNEDATLRCHGCDGDLYCQRCFWEGHEEFDLKDHQTSRYHLPCKQK